MDNMHEQPTLFDNIDNDGDVNNLALPVSTETGESEIPHSGNLGLEKPVDTFDNTTLEQAMDKDLVKTPDSPAPLLGLQNPNLRHKSESGQNNRLRNSLIAGGTAVVAAGVTLFVALGGGHSNQKDANGAPKKVTVSSSETSSPSNTNGSVKPVDSVAAMNPATLDTKFLSLAVTDSTPAAADESYQYFSDKQKSTESLAQWEAFVAQRNASFVGDIAVLRNPAELQQAGDTRQPVVANNFLHGNDGNYVLAVDESFNTTTQQWQIDAVMYDATGETQ